MNLIPSLRHHQPVTIFCGLTVLLSFATYLLPLPRETLPFLMVLIPACIAVALTAISEGKTGVRTLLGKLGQWRISPHWLAITLSLALVIRLTMSVVALLLGMIPALQVRPASAVQMLMLAVIFIMAAIPEEFGWRGYALPKLLTHHSALVASLVIGVLWGSLHLALVLPGMMNEGMPPLPTVLALVGGSVIFTWLYVNSGGNIMLTTIFHAAQSFFVIVNEGIGLEQQMWLLAGVYLAVALIIIICTGWKLTRSSTANRTIHPAIHLSLDDTTPG